jgi:serine/threonine-protein kinase
LTLLSPLNLGLKKEGEEFDDKVPAGTVIFHVPSAGMNVREGKIIRVMVSRGGEVIFVPDMRGQQTRSAEIAIRSAGLTLGEETTRYSLSIKKGSVMGQDPAPGAMAEKDSLVNIVISAGAPPEGVVLMPAFSGKPLSDVKKWAEDNSVQLKVVEDRANGVAPGTVIRQEPTPDTQMASDTIVTVTAASGESAALPSNSFHYEVPQGGDDRELRLTVLDESGEHEIFKGTRAPGSKMDIPLYAQGAARVRIFINNILIEERDVK